MNLPFRVSILGFVFIIFCTSAFSQDSAFVYYDTDKYVVKPHFKKELNNRLDDLGDLKKYFFILTGHTDSVAGIQYNQVLSKNRATSIVAILLNKGIEKDSISIGYKGELNPSYNNSSINGRAKNRAVRITWRNTGELEVFLVQKFPIGMDTTIIRTNNNCVLKVPPSSFMTSKGKNIGKGNINIYIKEYPNPAEMILGEIPMFSAKEKIMYDSYGMFSIKAFLNDTFELALKPKSEILVTCPLSDSTKGIKFFKFNEFKDEWKSLSNIDNIAKHETEQREVYHFVDTLIKSKNDDDANDTASYDPSNKFVSDSLKSGKEKEKIRKWKWFSFRFGLSFPKRKSRYKKTIKDVKSEKNRWVNVMGSDDMISPIPIESCGSFYPCPYEENLISMIDFEYDSHWNASFKDSLTIAPSICLGFKPSRFWNSGKFKIGISPAFFSNADEINKVKWRHKIKGYKSDFVKGLKSFDTYNVELKPIEGTRKYHLILDNPDGLDTLIVKDAWWRFKKAKKSFKRDKLPSNYVKKSSYGLHYCFWEMNQVYMSPEESKMGVLEWLDYYRNHTKEIDERHNYLYTKLDSINAIYCQFGDYLKILPKHSGTGKARRISSLGLYNYDRVISVDSFKEGAFYPKYKDNKDSIFSIKPNVIYVVVEGINGTLHFSRSLIGSQNILYPSDKAFTIVIVDWKGEFWINKNTKLPQNRGVLLFENISSEVKVGELNKLLKNQFSNE